MTHEEWAMFGGGFAVGVLFMLFLIAVLEQMGRCYF